VVGWVARYWRLDVIAIFRRASLAGLLELLTIDELCIAVVVPVV